MQGKVKTSSYGLLSELALLVECLAPGQNCITKVMHYIHERHLLEEKKKKSTILVLMGDMGTI